SHRQSAGDHSLGLPGLAQRPCPVEVAVPPLLVAADVRRLQPTSASTRAPLPTFPPALLVAADVSPWRRFGPPHQRQRRCVTQPNVARRATLGSIVPNISLPRPFRRGEG